MFDLTTTLDHSAEALETLSPEHRQSIHLSFYSGFSNEQVDSRGALANAELAINDFRHQLRTEMRTKVVRGELSDETVAVLTSGLDELRARVTASLK